jgi:hypothetical protein
VTLSLNGPSVAVTGFKGATLIGLPQREQFLLRRCPRR